MTETFNVWDSFNGAFRPGEPFLGSSNCRLIIAVEGFFTASTTMSQGISDHSNDSFQLYDLRIEAICPPNQRVLCSAKPGDHFTLQGEMLHLPLGQGFSIYSLGECANQCTFTKGVKRSDPEVRPTASGSRRVTI